MHLARWGAAHPGAVAVIRAACTPTASTSTTHRQHLALALAHLGDGQSGLDCLQAAPPAPATAVAIGRSLLRGDAAQRRLGETVLVRMARTANPPVSGTTLEAARLLSEPLQPDQALLAQLPESLREQSADVAAAQVRLGQRTAASVFSRWPDHPASWQLQWDLARADLLAGRWADAEAWLEALPHDSCLSHWLHGNGSGTVSAQPNRAGNRMLKPLAGAADPTPTRLLQLAAAAGWGNPTCPPGASHTTCRHNHRVGNLSTAAIPSSTNSGDWGWSKTHATAQPPHAPLNPDRLTAEPARRNASPKVVLLATGNAWGGLDSLWRSSLRLVGSLQHRFALHQQQHPRPFGEAFTSASDEAVVHEALLRAIAKQESRYSPGVQSPVGAQGLMQLMPATAAEVAGHPLSATEITNPDTNTQLGALYLQQLLRQWDGNPWLTVASYNAGPGAAGGWRTQNWSRTLSSGPNGFLTPRRGSTPKKCLGISGPTSTPKEHPAPAE